MKFGDRNLGVLIGAPFQIRHYRALRGIFTIFDDPTSVLRRYITAKGDYPVTVALTLSENSKYEIELFGHHDLCTVIEIFCRQDYWLSGEMKFIIDIGANIGLSSLYFLDKFPDCRVQMYEPLKENVERIFQNLKVFESRIRIFEKAVSTYTGNATFHWEPTGRYGTILESARSEASSREITVPCVDVNFLIDEALKEAGQIDLIKIDIEGMERDVLEAITPDRLAKVRTIFAEIDGRALELPGFRYSQYGSISRWEKFN